MFDCFKRYLGYLLASPLTLLGGFYASVFTLFGWYQWHGVVDDGLVWRLNVNKSPFWLLKLWQKWAGHAIGNVIVLKNEVNESNVTLKHELVHVRQCMTFGLLQPVIYLICYLTIKFCCKNSDPYYDNPFEIDARRGAGQVVDVQGALKQLQQENSNNA